jgi:hypothetical protein
MESMRVERGELAAPEGGLVGAAVERAAGEDAEDVEKRQRKRFAVGVAFRRPGVVEDGLGGAFARIVLVLHVGEDILEVRDRGNVVVHFLRASGKDAVLFGAEGSGIDRLGEDSGG